MAKEKDLIIQDIATFRTNHGGDYSDYYIGVTKHVGQRLVEETLLEHMLKGEFTKGTPFYSEECMNRDEAVSIEQYFQKFGMLKYNPRSHGVEDSKFIYCYKLTDENKKMILSEDSSEAKYMRANIKKFKDFNNGE
jgi:hypothetical protein